LKIKKLVILIMTIFFVVILTGSCFAKSDPIKAGMPDIKKVNSSEYNDNEHITKYASNYSIDVNAGTFDVVEKTLTYVVNVLFSLQVSLVQALIFMFDKALSFSAYKIFDNVLKSFIGGMYKSVFGVISGILLSCLGLYFFAKMIQQRQVEFWTGLAKTVIIIAIGVLYFTNPLLLARNVETASNELTNIVVTAASKAKADSNTSKGKEKKETITNIANDLWEEYVHKPWRILEFGNNEAADKWENKILKTTEDSDERKDTVEKMEKDKEVKTKAMVTKRLGFMFMYLIPLSINVILMAIFCIVIIGLQFLVTLVFVLGIFVFMVALIPSFGVETLKKWGMSIATLSGTKIVMAFMLMLILAFNNALFDTAKEEGWLYALMLQLAMYIVIYIYRERVLGIFSIAREVAVNPKRAFDRMKKHGELSPMSNYGQRMPIRNLKNGKIKSNSGNGKKSVIQKVKAGTARSIDTLTLKNSRNVSKDLIAANKREYNDGIEKQKSKDYLDKKYNFKKRKVDKMSPTKYHKDMGYVDRIDKRKKNGEDPFTQDEINKVRDRRKKAKDYIEIRKNRNELGVKFSNPVNGTSVEVKKKLPNYIPGGRSRARKLRRNDDEKK